MLLSVILALCNLGCGAEGLLGGLTTCSCSLAGRSNKAGQLLHLLIIHICHLGPEGS